MRKYYVLFPNQTNGIKLNEILTREGYKAFIAPTPRELSTSCGISLMVREEDVASIKEIIAREGVNSLGIMYVER